jgi:RNA polymerase sigma-70 factor (ECF subfamily)
LAVVALSEVDVATALSLLAATAGDSPAKHAKSPVAKINAERPLALTIMWESPHLPRLQQRHETSPRVHSGAEKGNLQATAGKSRAAPSHRAKRSLPIAGCGLSPGEGLRVRARAIDGMSLRDTGTGCPDSRGGSLGQPTSGDLDHDFVIQISRCNKLKDRPNCNVGARVRERDDEWTGLMRSAISGDSAAYHRLLKAVTPVLRAAARRGLARAGQPVDQSEDIVQDILLAVHLKRHTWDVSAPFAPWLFAIARNKLIDALRRRGRRIFVNIDDFAEVLPGEAVAETASAGEVAAQLQSLPARQRDVLQAIAVDSASIKDTAARLSMSEGAVRVALHRGLTSLTAKLREQ